MASLIALIAFVFVPFGVTAIAIATDETAPDSQTFDRAAPEVLGSSADDEADPGSPGSGFESYFESRIPGRQAAQDFERSTTRILDNRYEQLVADSPQVSLGLDGWLFLNAATAVECVDGATADAWKTELDRANDLVTASGRRFLFAVAPDKAIVVPEKLGPIENACEVANRSVVEKLTEGSYGLDLAEVVNEELHASQLDTHWSPLGAFAGAEMIIEAIEPGLWTEPAVSHEEVSRGGDMDQLVGFENTETMLLPTIETGVTLSTERFETSQPGRPLVISRSDKASNLSVILIHDSYGSYITKEDPSVYRSGLALDYIRPWFTTVANVRMPFLGMQTVGEEPTASAVRNAEVVTILSVQRKLSARLSPGQLVLPLAAALVDDLESHPVSGPVPSAGVIVVDGLSAEEVPQITGPELARSSFGTRTVILVEAGASLGGAYTGRFIALPQHLGSE